MKLTGILISAITFLFIFFTEACKHEPMQSALIQPVDPTSNGNNNNNNPTECSKDTVYFVQQVLPILQSSCAVSGCHNSLTHKEGIVLDNYAKIMSTGGIKTSNPTSSKIYSVMVRTGEEHMPPPPAPSMTSDQLSLISKWIGQGAKDNSCISNGCDTVNVKYSTHIKPLIQNYCQGCHSGAAPGGGIDLVTYAGVKSIADNGKFFGSISYLPNYKAMPQNGNKLTDCQILVVKLWINQGAPEN